MRRRQRGWGRSADLVWAWLPAARPALLELAITELDAAILEDRSPWAVPGSAVAAVLPGPMRELSDRGPDSVAAVGRLLRRLIEVDARMTGRHRGEIAKALRWMTAVPRRLVRTRVLLATAVAGGGSVEGRCLMTVALRGRPAARARVQLSPSTRLGLQFDDHCDRSGYASA